MRYKYLLTRQVKKRNNILNLTSYVFMYLCGLVLLMANSANAQEVSSKEITGVVQNVDGEPLAGVTIHAKGSAGGTVSGSEGKYVLKVTAADKVIIFTYLGFANKSVRINGRTTINVTMVRNISKLDETVVVAMGKQKEASVVGAISRVNMKDIRESPKISLMNAISGKMAGAISVQRSGEIGRKRSSFWIRGLSTFGSNKTPLILVDGVEREINDVPIDQVESVSILKDAAASAVYGSRAANGVVLITTRHGKEGKPQIDVEMQYGLTDLPKLPQFLDGADYARLYNEAQISVGETPTYSKEYIKKTASGVDPYLYPDVDWYKAIFKKFSQNAHATINVHGGGKTTRYFVGLGYYKEIGNFRTNPIYDYNSNIDLDKYTFRSNVDIDITPTTTVNLQLGGYLQDLNTMALGGDLYGTSYTPAEMLFNYANQANPIAYPVEIPIDTLPNGFGYGAPLSKDERNPVERLEASGYNDEFEFKVLSQLIVKQDLSSILRGLTARFSFAFDARNTTVLKRNRNLPTYHVDGRDADGNLIVSEVNEGSARSLDFHKSLGSQRAEELKLQLNYEKEIFPKHNLGAMVMYYQRDKKFGSAGNPVSSLPHRKQGISGRFTYNYDELYFFEFDLGYNGSENFAKGERFGLFPAVAGGWLISRQPFWENLKHTISMLKIRGSIGLVGSESLPGGQRFGYLTIYGGGHGRGGFAFGGGNPAKYPGVGLERVGIPDLTWETGLKKDIGLQIELLQGLANFSVDYFHEYRYHILTQRNSLPSIAGLTSAPFANIGKMKNRGFEATLNIRKRFSNKARIRLYGNFTYTKNKVIDIDEPQRKYSYQSRTGHPYGTKFGLVALGYFKDSAEIDKSPVQTYGPYRPGDVKYMDINDDGKIDIADEVPIGFSDIPEINYGFGVHAQYGNFDLGVFFRGQARVNYSLGGAYIPFSFGLGKMNMYKAALNRWTPENPNPKAQYPRIYPGKSSNNWQYSTKRLYDGSFLRLQNVELGYTLNSDFVKHVLKIQNLRFYVIADNVAVFSKWKMWDPETGSNDGEVYPFQRKMNFGIKFNF